MHPTFNVNATMAQPLLPGQTATLENGQWTVTPPPPCVKCWQPIKDHWYRVEMGSIYPPTASAVIEWTPPLYCSAKCLAEWAASIAGGTFTAREEQP